VLLASTEQTATNMAIPRPPDDAARCPLFIDAKDGKVHLWHEHENLFSYIRSDYAYTLGERR
jgi:hypothetical protein